MTSYLRRKWPEIVAILFFLMGGAVFTLATITGVLPEPFLLVDYSLVDGFNWTLAMASVAVFMIGASIGAAFALVAFLLAVLLGTSMTRVRSRT